MNFISEEIIDKVMDRIDEEEDLYETLLKNFAEDQPFLMAYLMSEGFEVLNETEKSLLFYMAMVIFESFKMREHEIHEIDLETISEIDEKNWTQVDERKFRTIKEIADYFFTDYEQEDLLAFVEDALVEDGEETLTHIGRNVLFVSMKTFIDSIHIAA
jgi:hypothetical protein